MVQSPDMPEFVHRLLCGPFCKQNGIRRETVKFLFDSGKGDHSQTCKDVRFPKDVIKACWSRYARTGDC